MNFFELKIFLKTYFFKEVIIIIKQIKSIDKKKFIAITPHSKEKIYIIYVVNFTCFKTHIQTFSYTQIETFKYANIFTSISN